MASDRGRCATLRKQRRARNVTGRRLNKPLSTGSKRTLDVERSQRKFARTWRNFGHGEQGSAGQRGLSHASVGGARNLRKGRRLTISALHKDRSPGNQTARKTLLGRTTKTESVRVQTRTARANARVHAGARAHVGTLDPSQGISGRKLRKHRPKFRELQAEAQPQGQAETAESGEVARKTTSDSQKEKSNFLCAGTKRNTSRTRTSRLKVEEGEATHAPLRLAP